MLQNIRSLCLTIIIFCTVSGGTSALAASPELPSDLLKKPWDAVWISCPERDLTSYGVFHFRKEFNLKENPESFVVHVSADNRYKLYVNGSEVCDGPARGDLWHWRFETVDIAPYLHTGKNVLAAVVWNFGKHVPWAQMTHSTVFVVQGNTEREEVVNTDGSWKVRENQAYFPIPVDRKAVMGFTAVGPGERVDGILYPWDWEKTDYDDSLWKSALVVGRATPWEIRDADSYWNLVPRNIPPMEKKLLPLARIRRTDGLDVNISSLSPRNPLTIPARAKVKILFDQSRIVTAYPKITVNGGAGSSITMTYAEALVDDHGNKAHRDSVEGRQVLGFNDVFLPDGGEERSFSPLWFRAFRYVGMEIETSDQALTVLSLDNQFVAYPFREEASFESDDASLKEIWNVAWHTARLCAGETYFDCPYYEQLQYVGDTRIQALISLYVSGDDRLMRNAIMQFDDSRIPDGLTYSRYPSAVPQIIPPYSLFWIAMLYDYWMHREDEKFVRGYMQGVSGVIDWFEKHLTSNDLLGNLPWWNFVDWVPEYDAGVPPGAEKGENSVISLQFVYALQLAEKIATGLGQEDEARHYHQLAGRVASAVFKHCWSDTRELIAETPEKKQFSQQANSMAILVDLFPPEGQRRVFDKIITEKDLIQCTFYYRFYLLRALKKVGLGERYLEMLEPWHEMIGMGLTTFAEKPEPTRSDCHAWSSSPIYELLATVCGIEPSAPSFRRVRIEPHLGELKFIEGVMPHPRGTISCNLRRQGRDGITGEIVLPDGLAGDFFWRGEKIELKQGKQLINIR